MATIRHRITKHDIIACILAFPVSTGRRNGDASGATRRAASFNFANQLIGRVDQGHEHGDMLDTYLMNGFGKCTAKTTFSVQSHTSRWKTHSKCSKTCIGAVEVVRYCSRVASSSSHTPISRGDVPERYYGSGWGFRPPSGPKGPRYR